MRSSLEERARKRRNELCRAFAGQSKAAWHDTMYYMYWAYYCAIANGTTSSDEDIAECASDEAGNGEVEVEWRWRGYDV